VSLWEHSSTLAAEHSTRCFGPAAQSLDWKLLCWQEKAVVGAHMLPTGGQHSSIAAGSMKLAVVEGEVGMSCIVGIDMSNQPRNAQVVSSRHGLAPRCTGQSRLRRRQVTRSRRRVDCCAGHGWCENRLDPGGEQVENAYVGEGLEE